MWRPPPLGPTAASRPFSLLGSFSLFPSPYLLSPVSSPRPVSPPPRVRSRPPLGSLPTRMPGRPPPPLVRLPRLRAPPPPPPPPPPRPRPPHPRAPPLGSLPSPPPPGDSARLLAARLPWLPLLLGSPRRSASRPAPPVRRAFGVGCPCAFFLPPPLRRLSVRKQPAGHPLRPTPTRRMIRNPEVAHA